MRGSQLNNSDQKKSSQERGVMQNSEYHLQPCEKDQQYKCKNADGFLILNLKKYSR